jgi:hypothetical protein
MVPKRKILEEKDPRREGSQEKDPRRERLPGERS